jgi:cytochrome c oxidase subunit I
MSFAGSMGVARRSWDIAATGSVYGPTAHLFMAMVGIGGVLAFLGLITFVLLTVLSLLFGRSNAGRKMEDWGTPKTLSTGSASARTGGAPAAHEHQTQGTMVLALVFLACFAVYYFANWKALADVWPVR